MHMHAGVDTSFLQNVFAFGALCESLSCKMIFRIPEWAMENIHGKNEDYLIKEISTAMISFYEKPETGSIRSLIRP